MNVIRNMIVCFTFIGVCVGFVSCFKQTEPVESKSFDSKKWKSVSDVDLEKSHLRLSMVDDLVSSRKLIGLNRDEVIAILGAPQANHLFENIELVYLVGADRHFGIDFEWLVIETNENGIVVATEIRIQ